MHTHQTYRQILSAQALSDDELVKRIAAGCRTAMHALYARHSRRVYRFALRLLGDPAAADDVVSQVFLDVFRAAPRFEGRSSVSTWLLAICRNKAYLLRRRRAPDQLDEGMVSMIESTDETAEDSLQRQDVAKIIKAALDRLSAAHREIIDLVYYQNLSVEEAGEVLKIPKNTVKTRMFYARKHLAALLGKTAIGKEVPV